MISVKSDKQTKACPGNRALLKVLRFSKKVVIFSFSSVVLFTTVMIIVIIAGNSDPDTLITEFFGYFKIEGGILGLLKAVETVIDLFNSRQNGVSAPASAGMTGEILNVIGGTDKE